MFKSLESLIILRAIHICIIIAVAIIFYQASNLPDGLWIVISVLAIIGPFAPSLSFKKSGLRVLGTFAGLLLSVILWAIMHYSQAFIPIVAVILVYCLVFSLTKEYTYFIMLVTTLICLNYDYMNLFIKNEDSFLINRAMCVFIGVSIYLFFDFFVFRNAYNNATVLVNKNHLDELLEGSVVYETIFEIDAALNKISAEIAKLEALQTECKNALGDQTKTVELIEYYLQKLQEKYHTITLMAYKFI